MIRGKFFTAAAEIVALATLVMIFTACEVIDQYLPTAPEAGPQPVPKAVQDATGPAAENVLQPAIVEPTVGMIRESAPADYPTTGILAVTLEPVMAVPTASAPTDAQR